jgi:hypothetical protein
MLSLFYIVYGIRPHRMKDKIYPLYSVNDFYKAKQYKSELEAEGISTKILTDSIHIETYGIEKGKIVKLPYF